MAGDGSGYVSVGYVGPGYLSGGGGTAAPVFVQGASGTTYILLSQWVATPLPWLPGCERWDCTLLVDIVSSFAVSGQVNELPALQLGAELVQRLGGQRLPLTQGWQMSPVFLSQASTVTDDTAKETVDVHRYYRLRTTLEFHS
ncbi:hypothetical protein [Hymenobacter fodinae]|uniref:hypothetical protein n=1 Tax=Hymenobacter fodinae TaxID=2510796 RepID=UPI0010812584|nr:hypothetical protein [Hymenobacter fodinae]